MSDNAPTEHRLARRTVILIAAIVVVVLLIVAFLVVSAVTRSPGETDSAAPTSTLSIKPSPTPTGGGYTPAPTATKSIRPAGPIATPTGTASPGTEAKAVPLDATAQPLTGVRVRLTDLASVTGKANGLGEIDGPAIRFSVVITNETNRALSLASVVTNVTYGSTDTPANELESVRRALPQFVAKGATVTGTFTFTLAKADRSDVSITVDYHVGVPITVFSGSVPR